MIIKPASENDLEELIDLEQIGFPIGERWSEQSWRSELDAADGLVLVGRDLADGALRGAAAFRQLDEVAELFRVIVLPQSRRGGRGSELICAGESWAASLGARRMMLEVRDDNLAARALYLKLGFEPVAVRNDYYGSGTKAVVMERKLDEVERGLGEAEHKLGEAEHKLGESDQLPQLSQLPQLRPLVKQEAER